MLSLAVIPEVSIRQASDSILQPAMNQANLAPPVADRRGSGSSTAGVFFPISLCDPLV